MASRYAGDGLDPRTVCRRDTYQLDAHQVDTFEALMEVPDPKLYEWITGAKETPAEYETALMQQLRSFHLGGSEHVR